MAEILCQILHPTAILKVAFLCCSKTFKNLTRQARMFVRPVIFGLEPFPGGGKFEPTGKSLEQAHAPLHLDVDWTLAVGFLGMCWARAIKMAEAEVAET